jgi:oxygen-independent coproporphyrinogen-3 oxidase
LAGIYIHIPFCKQACNYCNFHFSTSLKLKDEMIAALVKEIEITAVPIAQNIDVVPFIALEKEKIETLYFGGGTPSIINLADLELLLNALQEKFIFRDNIEITLEANPDDITAVKLALWEKGWH